MNTFPFGWRDGDFAEARPGTPLRDSTYEPPDDAARLLLSGEMTLLI